MKAIERALEPRAGAKIDGEARPGELRPRSKSRMPSAVPRSQCVAARNRSLRGSPTTCSTRLALSSAPTGTLVVGKVRELELELVERCVDLAQARVVPLDALLERTDCRDLVGGVAAGALLLADALRGFVALLFQGLRFDQDGAPFGVERGPAIDELEVDAAIGQARLHLVGALAEKVPGRHGAGSLARVGNGQTLTGQRLDGLWWPNAPSFTIMDPTPKSPRARVRGVRLTKPSRRRPTALADNAMAMRATAASVRSEVAPAGAAQPVGGLRSIDHRPGAVDEASATAGEATGTPVTDRTPASLLPVACAASWLVIAAFQREPSVAAEARYLGCHCRSPARRASRGAADRHAARHFHRPARRDSLGTPGNGRPRRRGRRAPRGDPGDRSRDPVGANAQRRGRGARHDRVAAVADRGARAGCSDPRAQRRPARSHHARRRLGGGVVRRRRGGDPASRWAARPAAAALAGATAFVLGPGSR